MEEEKIKAEDPELDMFYVDMIRIEREKAERARKKALTKELKEILKAKK